MALTIPENRALLRSIAIPSPPPFGRSCTIQLLETGAQFVACTSRSGSVRTSQVMDVDGARLSTNEVRVIQPRAIPIEVEQVSEVEKFEQSRTMVTQFTSDGTTGDIQVDMGNASFNGNIISVQVEVSETLVGTAALAVRSENGQSVFQGTGLTEGGVLGLEPDFVAVGLFADPLFVPTSNVPVIAGEGVILVMRLAGTVIAGAVRAFVSVTLQGVGEDLSKQILLRATVPPTSLSVAVSGSPAAAPVAGVPAGLTGIVSALVRFPEWMIVQGGVPMNLLGRSTRGFNPVTIPNLGGEWMVNLKLTKSFIMNLRTREALINVKPVVFSKLTPAGDVLEEPERQQRRQFLTGPVSAFRALSALAEVEFITVPGESLIFGAGGVPTRFVDEFGSRI